MYGTACAASSLFTVTRTSSEPAAASAAICSMLLCTSAVSVLVMDCTTTGASEPTRTWPTIAVTVRLRCTSGMLPPTAKFTRPEPPLFRGRRLAVLACFVLVGGEIGLLARQQLVGLLRGCVGSFKRGGS